MAIILKKITNSLTIMSEYVDCFRKLHPLALLFITHGYPFRIIYKYDTLQMLLLRSRNTTGRPTGYRIKTCLIVLVFKFSACNTSYYCIIRLRPRLELQNYVANIYLCHTRTFYMFLKLSRTIRRLLSSEK